MNSGVARIASIDVLRGFAVLGILLINIQTFSMIESAYVNPTAYGEFAGVNAVVWGFTRLFADQKFMTLFSMLFGAFVDEDEEALWSAVRERVLAGKEAEVEKEIVKVRRAEAGSKSRDAEDWKVPR